LNKNRNENRYLVDIYTVKTTVVVFEFEDSFG